MSSTAAPAQHGLWFVSRNYDLTFLHMPVWICWAIAFLLPASVLNIDLPAWFWISTVLLIDTGHVWSTLWRTVFDKQAMDINKGLYLKICIVMFLFCFAFASVSEMVFWTMAAYFAIYHFIKQQFGFTALYQNRLLMHHGARIEKHEKTRMRLLDQLAIYVGTSFPVIWWHFNLPRKMWWMIENDFYNLTGIKTFLLSLPVGEAIISSAASLFYIVWVGVLAAWIFYHIKIIKKYSIEFPLGKFLWVLGTGFNWWLGIVFFNSELVFTLTSNVAHGIPYYGLVGLYLFKRFTEEKEKKLAQSTEAPKEPRAPQQEKWSTIRKVILIFGIPVLFIGFFEEYLWYVFVTREYEEIFGVIGSFGLQVAESKWTLALATTCIAFPQFAHYILDGYIWKANKRNPKLKQYLFS